MISALIRWVAGPVPAAEATREERLRSTRRLYRLLPAAIAVCVVFAVLTASTFLWILAAAGAFLRVAGLGSITHSIRRERTRDG